VSGPQVEVQLLRLDEDLPVPSYAMPGDAGVDLFARESVTLAPGQRQLVPTGIAITLPPGYAAFVHPRSGLSVRHGLSMVNAPGTIDAGYRGEIKVNLINLDPADSVTLSRGDRIAQLVVQQVASVVFAIVDELSESGRGVSGFGSTGMLGSARQVRDSA
jgi:dUTP pyrophosphatase